MAPGDEWPTRCAWCGACERSSAGARRSASSSPARAQAPPRRRPHQLSSTPSAARASAWATAAGASPQSGVECGCTRTGPYVNPATGKLIGPSTREASSPNDVYQATLQWSPNVHVLKITRGGVVLRDLCVVAGTAAWRFGQDDHRFAYHDVSGAAPDQVHNVHLYDLAASGAPLVKELHEPLRTSRLVSSPHGRRPPFARLATSTSTALTIVDAATGAPRHDTARRPSITSRR